MSKSPWRSWGRLTAIVLVAAGIAAVATLAAQSSGDKWWPGYSGDAGNTPSASPALLQAFAQTMATLPMAQTKTVFGSPAAFANGHMFAGIQNESFFLRLPDAERESFMQTVSADQWEPMPGRPMREYVVVPAPLIEATASL